MACQLAGVLAGLAERQGLEREVEALTGVADIGRALLQADGPEGALDIAAGALWRGSRAPVAIWWGDDQGPRTLSAVAGLNAEKTTLLEQRMGTVLPWARRRRAAADCAGGSPTPWEPSASRFVKRVTPSCSSPATSPCCNAGSR